MLKFLRSLDQFGVAFQPSIKYSTHQYKTCCGGLMSILLYGLSLAYLIYMFIQWQTGQLLPKIIQASDKQDSALFQNEGQFMEIGMRKFGYTKIDPFDPNALILQPLVHYIIDDIWDNKTLIPNYESIKQDNDFFNIYISNLTLSLGEVKQQVSYLNMRLELCLHYVKKNIQKMDNNVQINHRQKTFSPNQQIQLNLPNLHLNSTLKQNNQKLLLLSFIVITINSKQLQVEAINNIISMYYPDFKFVKITKNIFGKIIKAESNGKQFVLQSFLQYYKRLQDISEVKLSISNQIYEISRLQFMFMSNQPSQAQQIHQYGIPFNCPLVESLDMTSKLEVYNLDREQNLKSNKIQTIEMTHQISTDSKFLQNDDTYQLKDSDFDLMIMPEELDQIQ